MKGKLVVGVSVLTLTLGAAPTAPASTLPTGPLPSLGAGLDSGVSQSTGAGTGGLQLNLDAPLNALAGGSVGGDVNQQSNARTNTRAYSNASEPSTQPAQGGSSSSSGQGSTGADLPSSHSRDNGTRGSQDGAVHRTDSKAGADARTGHAGAPTSRITAESRNREAYRHRARASADGASGGWNQRWALEDQDGFWNLAQCGCYVRHGRKSEDAPRHVPTWPAAVTEPQLFAGWPWVVLSGLLIMTGVVMSRRPD